MSKIKITKNEVLKGEDYFKKDIVESSINLTKNDFFLYKIKKTLEKSFQVVECEEEKLTLSSYITQANSLREKIKDFFEFNVAVTNFLLEEKEAYKIADIVDKATGVANKENN